MTPIEWIAKELLNLDIAYEMGLDKNEFLERRIGIIKKAKEMEESQAHQYAEFAIRCDRKDMKILNFKDWIKL